MIRPQEGRLEKDALIYVGSLLAVQAKKMRVDGK